MPEPDTHDRILTAAHALVESDGRSALSFRKVASGAGVSVGTVQYYFASIEQLVDALTDPWHDGLAALFDEAFRRLPQTPDRQRLLLDLGVDIYRLARAHRELLLTRRLDTLNRGALLSRRQTSATRWRQQGSTLAASLVGGDPQRWRLGFIAAEHLLVGFALADEEELGADDAAVEAFLRDALLGLARSTVLGEAPPVETTEP